MTPEANVDISKDSGLSNHTGGDVSVSITMPLPELDDQTKINLAIMARDIFSRYLARGCDNYIILEPKLREKVFAKFGYSEPNQFSSPFGVENHQNSMAEGFIDEKALLRNLTFDLFKEVLKPVMIELQHAYKSFQ